MIILILLRISEVKNEQRNGKTDTSGRSVGDGLEITILRTMRLMNWTLFLTERRLLNSLRL